MRACKANHLLSRVLALLLSATLLPINPAGALAPKSALKHKPATEKSKIPAGVPLRPLRENLTDEEIRVLKIYEKLDSLNMRMYTASLARAHVKREVQKMERRKAKGENNLDAPIAEFKQIEQDWDKQLREYRAELETEKNNFPAETVGESELRKEARDFIAKALLLIDKNQQGAAEAVLVGAKRRVIGEFRKMLTEHLGSVPRLRAEELMAKDRFGQDVRTITYGGFGMRIRKDGTVVTPLRHYEKDPRHDLWVLVWDKEALKTLPKAMRQKIHIQESEFKEFRNVIGCMKDIVDMKSQLVEARGDLEPAQQATMAHLLVGKILQLNPSGFQKLLREQGKEVERSLKPVLAELGIRGKKREEFLKKVLVQFRNIQAELAVSDPLPLGPQERLKKIKEFRVLWDRLLKEEITAQGITLDEEKMKAIRYEWHKVRADNLRGQAGELVARMDPFGKIKDPYKRYALLHLHMAVKLLTSGRADRNVLEFLETAQAYLYKRALNTQSIRRSVERQGAALQAEYARLEQRDNGIRAGLDAMESMLRASRDVSAAKAQAVRMAQAYFDENFNEPGMRRAKRRLEVVAEQLPRLIPLREQIDNTVRQRVELEEDIARHQETLADLKKEQSGLRKERLAPQKARTDFLVRVTAARERLEALAEEASASVDDRTQSLKAMLIALPRSLSGNPQKSRSTARDIEGLAARMKKFLTDEVPVIRAKRWREKLRTGIESVMQNLDAAREAAVRHAELLSDQDRPSRLRAQAADAAQRIALETELLGAAQESRETAWQAVVRAQAAFDKAAQGRIHNNLDLMRQDILHKYKEDVAPAQEGPAHAFFDSMRLRLLDDALLRQGVPPETIDKLIQLLYDLRGPARYEGGKIYSEDFLLKLDAEISQLSGQPAKSFFQLAREILYHEMAHEYLSRGEGWDMVLRHVRNSPDFPRYQMLMYKAFPDMLHIWPNPDNMAGEMAAKLASLLFEGESSTSVMNPDLRAELTALKAKLQTEPAFQVLTGGGIEASGGEHNQKLVFTMLKALLGKRAEAVARRSRDALEAEAREDVEQLRRRADGILAEIRGHIQKNASQKPSAEEEKLAELQKSGRPVTVEQYIALLRNLKLGGLADGKDRAAQMARLVKRLHIPPEWLEKLEYVYHARKGEKEDLRKITQPPGEFYTRLLLYHSKENAAAQGRQDDEDFEVVALVWEPRHLTPVHDHGLNNKGMRNVGVVKVLKGNPRIRTYALSEFDEAAGRAKVKMLGSRTVAPGAISTVQEIHQVDNATDDYVVGLHTYSGIIEEAYSFTPTGRNSFERAKEVDAEARKIPYEDTYLSVSLEEIDKAPTKAELAAAVRGEIAAHLQGMAGEEALKALHHAVQLGLRPEDADALLGMIRDAGLLRAGPLLDKIIPSVVRAHFLGEDRKPMDQRQWRYDAVHDTYERQEPGIKGIVASRVAPGRFGIQGGGLPSDALARLKDYVESAEFIVHPEYTERGGEKKVYFNMAGGLAAKEPKTGGEESDDMRRILSTFPLVQQRLGGLAARTVMLDNVTTTIGTVRRKHDHLKIQEVLTPLDDHLRYLWLAGDRKGAERVVDEFIALQHRMWERGVFDWDFKIANYGVNRRGEVLVLDFGHIEGDLELEPEMNADIQSALISMNHNNEAFLSNSLSDQLGSYYAEKAELQLSWRIFSSRWDQRPYTRAALEMPLPENLERRKAMRDQLRAVKARIKEAYRLFGDSEDYKARVTAIVREDMFGKPVSYQMELALEAMDPRPFRLTRRILRQVQREYRIRRYDDLDLAMETRQEMAVHLMQALGRVSDKEFGDLVFCFDTFVLRPYRRDLRGLVPRDIVISKVREAVLRKVQEKDAEGAVAVLARGIQMGLYPVQTAENLEILYKAGMLVDSPGLRSVVDHARFAPKASPRWGWDGFLRLKQLLENAA